MSTVRIVPPDGCTNKDEGAWETNGTKVFVGDQQITGVTGITIRLDMDSVWRATIECVVQPMEIVAESCVCGDPESQGVTHRLDGPCHVG